MNYSENLISILSVFGGLIVIFVLISIWYFYNVTIKRWEKTEGIIIENSVIYDNRDIDSHAGWKNSIAYEYKIGGKYYQNKKYTKNLTMTYGFKYQVETDDRFPKGNSVTVYYNPAKPGESVIDNEFNYYNFAILLFSAMLFAIAYYNWK